MPPAPLEPADALAILRHLAAAGVPFLIIGGHAVSFHGYVRTTEDADIIFLRNPDSEVRLLNALTSIHASWITPERDPQTRLERLTPVTAAYLQANHLLMVNTDLGFLDIYDYVPGFPEVPVATLRHDSVKLGPLEFVSLSWLRRLKQAAGRHKDLDDLEHLPAV